MNIRHTLTAACIVGIAACTACNKSASTSDNLLIPVSSISVSPTNHQLAIDSSIQLHADIEPANATIKTIKWSSSHPNIASVDSSTGRVTAISPGSASITATTIDGGHASHCSITVMLPSTSPPPPVMQELVFKPHLATTLSVTIEWTAEVDIMIEWGDGIQTLVYAYENPPTHTYADRGPYSITISGVGMYDGITSLSFRSPMRDTLHLAALSALRTLSITSGTLASLDVSGCTALADISCTGNQLTRLNVKTLPRLRSLRCNNNRIDSLDVRGMTSLATLDCYGNAIRALYISGCSELREVNCYSNSLTSLDAYALTALETLNCYGNNIDDDMLVLTGCTALQTLYCHSNPLNSPNIEGLHALRKLDCNYPFTAQLVALLSLLPQRSANDGARLTLLTRRGSAFEAEVTDDMRTAVDAAKDDARSRNWTIEEQ
jgi:hypothetical protein